MPQDSLSVKREVEPGLPWLGASSGLHILAGVSGM
jgi:hypothetical protein